TDIYSLGVVLYQMVTGSVPYEASTPIAVVVKHINEQLPSPRSINPDLPVAVEAVILRAMAKNADERYQTCGDLAADLQRAVSGQQVAAALPPPVTHQPAKTAALAEDLPAQTAVLPPEADLEDDASGEEPKKRRRLLPILGGVVLGCVLLLCVGTVLSGLFGADEPEPIANATATANPDGAVDTQPTAEPDANPDDNPGSGDQDNPPPPPPSGNLTCPPDQRVIATDLRGFDVLESTTNINTEVDDEGSLLMQADDEEAFYVFPILARSFSIEVALGYPPDTAGDFVLVTRLDTGLETGYSLVVSPAEQGLLLLRDSELVGEAYGVPLPNPDEGPLRLTMRFMDDRIDAGVNGNMVLSFVDPEPLQAGRIALGAFDGEFRVQRVQMCSQDGARILFEEPFVDPDLPLWEAIGFEEAEGEVADGELYVELVPGTGIEQEGVVGFPSLEAPAIVVEAAALPQPPFSVVTTVDIQPEENFQGAGLIVLNEAEAPLLTLIRGYCDEGENCEGDAIYMEAWTLAGQRTIGRITEGGGDLPDGPVMLRLMFEEDLIIGEYSTNGGMRWIAVGAVPYVVEQRAAFFGLFTTTGFAEDVEPLPAIFEHFLVLVNN
ncbi:MAG: hypothetical protein ACFB51_16405, partial [Anaerolineae bacterium]